MAEHDIRSPTSTKRVIRDFGRAAGGALVFSLPMLMTMELWWLGFYLDRIRLLSLFIMTLPLLVVLSRHIGFEETRGWRDDVWDALIALGVSAIVCTTLLTLFGTLTFDTPLDEIIGKIAIQIVPGSIGALLAKSQFGDGPSDHEDVGQQEEPYGGELFLMCVGALFLGFNVAPTEEVMLISYQVTEWHALAVVALSVVLMHGFVFAVGFAGGSEVTPEDSWWSPFLRLTLPGYVIALTISLLLLWFFGRTEGLSLNSNVIAMVILALPAAIGAAAARLIL